MDNRQRVAKLEQAIALIREVEFSYPIREAKRKELYSFVAQHCSFIGVLGQFIQRLKETL